MLDPDSLLTETSPDEEDISNREAKIEELKLKELDLDKRIASLNRLRETRRDLLIEELESLRTEIERRRHDLDALQNVAEEPTGPPSFRWVDGDEFNILCTVVILVNLITMICSHWYGEFWVMDQFFLSFYLVEIILRSVLHEWGFLFGNPYTVVWNWMDLFIVTTGVIDQWCLPNLSTWGPEASGLRVLRLLRLVRLLKLVKFFFLTNLDWTESTKFQTFISCVIVFNAITLGMELDIQWSGWFWLEELMLATYFFELAARCKRQGWNFFQDREDWAWNNLDFIIVVGGVMDLWITPVYNLAKSWLFGAPIEVKNSGGSLLPLLRMLRLLRILKLLRLLKSFKPLYKLSLGVLEAMQAMQWVLMLTLILLYAVAILFTSLLGHGNMFDVNIPEESKRQFGSVLRSMFVLFRVMNGDQTPMDPLLHSVQLKILFALFMIVSNWMVLAILTAVVSENMISTTAEHARVEKALDDKKKKEDREESLKELFHSMDGDGDGRVDESDFNSMLEDEEMSAAFLEKTGLNVRDLKDLFSHLSIQDENGNLVIDQASFCEKMQDEGNDVSERSVFRLERQMRLVESRIEQKLLSVRKELQEIIPPDFKELQAKLHSDGLG